MVTIEELVQERQWMYNQRNPGETLNTDVFMYGVGYFLQVVIGNGQICDGNKLRCPCSKCKNKHFREIGLCETHLFTYGFVKDYYNWTNHGEEIAEVSSSWDNNINNFQDQNDAFSGQGIDSRFGDMVSDIAGPSNYDQPQSAEPEEPNQAASQLYDLFKSSCEPVFEGCTSETQLSIAMKMLQIKTDHGLSEAAYDSICATIGNLLDCEHLVPTTFRETKKFVSGLGMGYIRIDVCVNGCMIYYGGDENLSTCRYCGDPRYKETRKQQSSRSYNRISRSQMFYLPIIPRIQQLYMNEITAEHMTWHANTDRDPDVMVHPADGESWKHYDRINPDFSSDLRNVRLGLCSDGFSPFGMSAKSYSCWPVMLTPYNLPPWMCMKTRYMWLTVLIPGPRIPKKRIDIYLRPLIDDLLILWNYGVQTFDSYNKQNFNMRAVLMWTVSDFPAYGMLSGWSTQGRLGCPYCKEDTKTFVLKNGRKVSYFDCHRRFLPVGHPYRENRQSFYYGREEHNSPVIFLNGHAVYERVCHLKTIFEQIPDEKLPGYGIHHNWTKKSIFWELPYWKDMLLRHNLDVMHIEKNVFENLFNTIMNVKGKTKDNGAKFRKDVALYCDRPESESESDSDI